MNDFHQKIADFIMVRRVRANMIERKAGGMPTHYQRELIAGLRDEADRLEAAWKHEKAAIEADALAVGGLVEASRKQKPTTEKSSAVGDAAKLREAAKYVQSTMERLRDPTDKNNAEFVRIWEIVSAALAAPPRNCDRFGTDNAEASLVYEEFCDRAEVEESINGAIAWLLSLDADKEGGAK